VRRECSCLLIHFHISLVFRSEPFHLTTIRPLLQPSTTSHIVCPSISTNRTHSSPKSFLEDHDPEFDNDNRVVLQLFAVGSRNCIGRNLAYVEVRYILTKVLFNFDLELAEAMSGNWADQKTYSLWEKTSLWVKVSSRQ